MRIAVVNEVSSSVKNTAIMTALQETDNEIFNIGMTSPEDKPELTYLHTALISALLLQLGSVEMVIGGCGTGQGYMNGVLQYSGVACALITEPLDAWLARRINAPNCISLALNKGYGWAADENLKLIFQALFAPVEDEGYPPLRAVSQEESRRALRKISETTHYPMEEIIRRLDPRVKGPVFTSRKFCDMVERAPDSQLKLFVLSCIRTGEII